MYIKQAYEILGVTDNADRNEIKRKYRELMHKVHPDACAHNTDTQQDDIHNSDSYDYSAYEINEAYSVICEYIDSSSKKTFNTGYSFYDSHEYGNNMDSHFQYSDWSASSDKREYGWDATENDNAYCNRSIYHYVEDYDGRNIGSFKIAHGRYIWTVEEDFKLFIRSIFECSEKLLGDIERQLDKSCDADKKLVIQAELAYLIAQQFIAATDTLGKILTSLESDDSEIFYVESMLEVMQGAPFIKAGMTLYPSGIRRHRLYLMTKSGQEAGYVSFRDDRLYYILIPILEQKRALVKIEVSRKQDRLNTRQPNKYKNLDLWIKMEDNDDNKFPENINMQIEELLKKYRSIID